MSIKMGHPLRLQSRISFAKFYQIKWFPVRIPFMHRHEVHDRFRCADIVSSNNCKGCVRRLEQIFGRRSPNFLGTGPFDTVHSPPNEPGSTLQSKNRPDYVICDVFPVPVRSNVGRKSRNPSKAERAFRWSPLQVPQSFAISSPSTT